MLDWLRKHIQGGVRRIADLGGRVIDTITAVWHVLTSFWHIMRMVFADLGHVLTGWLHFLLNVIEWTGNTLWHLATIAIPNAAHWAARQAIKWAGQAVHTIHQMLSTVISNVYQWALSLFNHILDLIGRAMRYALGLVSPIVAWMSKYANRAVHLVLNPRLLAMWIIPHLWSPLWRYLESKATPIGVWILRRSIGAVGRAAGMIETVLAKIL